MDRSKVLTFPFVEGLGFAVALALALVFCSCDQGPLLESRGGKLVPPTIYPVTILPIMIRCSNSPTLSGDLTDLLYQVECLFNESAGVSTSHRSPKGNRQMRRILNQCANAAVRTKGSIFEMVYHRLVLRLGHNQTIGAIANRLCRLIWIILHRGVRYEERGQVLCERLKRTRTARMIRQLRSLGYRVEPLTVQVNPA